MIGKIQTKGLCPDARGVVVIHRRLGYMALRDSRRSDGILLGQKCARCESIKAEKTQDQIHQGTCGAGRAKEKTHCGKEECQSAVSMRNKVLVKRNPFSQTISPIKHHSAVMH